MLEAGRTVAVAGWREQAALRMVGMGISEWGPR